MDPARLDSHVSNFTALLDLRSTLLRFGSLLNDMDVLTRQAFEDIPTPPRGDKTSEKRHRKVKGALVSLHGQIINVMDVVLGLQSMYQAGLVSRSGRTVTIGYILNLRNYLLYGCRLEVELEEEEEQDP